jgi:hypothetical protein
MPLLPSLPLISFPIQAEQTTTHLPVYPNCMFTTWVVARIAIRNIFELKFCDYDLVGGI